jgi:branched-subunit amino acid transport protein
MELWFLVVAMGLITFALRLSFVLGANHIVLPNSLQRALRYAPPAVLSAIVFPELVTPDGAVDLSPRNSRLVAGLLAAVVAWRTENVLLTIAVGMLVLWTLEWLGSS